MQAAILKTVSGADLQINAGAKVIALLAQALDKFLNEDTLHENALQGTRICLSNCY